MDLESDPLPTEPILCFQCAPLSGRCDDEQQCLDGSDEHRCLDLLWKKPVVRPPPPAIVHFSRTGDILVRSLTESIASRGVRSSCPETHWWCPDSTYCLPVYLRCNGVYDCPGHEDEQGCDVYVCPGFYRCRASRVCVHASDVCDGWSLCPQRDDEWLCGQVCPRHCRCQGLAFVCTAVFPAAAYPGLRYLQAGGSGLGHRHLHANLLLVHLGLARCNIRRVTRFSFPNLRSLDLSDNLLTAVGVADLQGMRELTVLFLAGNPLTSLFSETTVSFSAMNALDLSRVRLHSVNSAVFLAFPSLQKLNLSDSGARRLTWNSSELPSTLLRVLDLGGNPLAEFNRDVLREFTQLQRVVADTFRLCCAAVLPPGFPPNRCLAPRDRVSSCHALLGSPSQRGAAAALAAMALLGNVASLAVRTGVSRSALASSGEVFLTHLSVADFGAGLHLAVLGVADGTLRGPYVWADARWRHSATCRLAGCLCLLAQLAAACLLALLTLDRVLSHRPPGRCWRFRPRSAHLACAAVWTGSALLAGLPLLPVTSHWALYGQTAACVPLPLVHDVSSAGYDYVLGVLVLFNFILFLLIALGQVFVRVGGKKTTTVAVRRNDSAEWTGPGSQLLVLFSLGAGSLVSGLGLLNFQSYHVVPQRIHTTVALFGRASSSAVNPYLHFLGRWLESRKRTREERILRMLSARTQK